MRCAKVGRKCSYEFARFIFVDGNGKPLPSANDRTSAIDRSAQATPTSYPQEDLTRPETFFFFPGIAGYYQDKDGNLDTYMSRYKSWDICDTCMSLGPKVICWHNQEGLPSLLKLRPRCARCRLAFRDARTAHFCTHTVSYDSMKSYNNRLIKVDPQLGSLCKGVTERSKIKQILAEYFEGTCHGEE